MTPVGVRMDAQIEFWCVNSDAGLAPSPARGASSGSNVHRESSVERRVLIGTQGWNYAAWVGPFYPDGTRPADMLSLYAQAFATVEVDSTFYAIPPPNTVRGWAARSPDGFVFSLKLPQEITHERHLRRAEAE